MEYVIDPSKVDNVAELVLESHTPREAARFILTWLGWKAKARTIALWRDEGNALALEFGLEIDESSLLEAKALWASRAPDAGRTPISSRVAVLLPVERVEDAWLYLDGVDGALDFTDLSEGAGIAVKAVRRGGATMGRMPREVKREELIATLNLHEWNIARVARVKRVTRKTVYDWLTKFGIERHRVPK